MGFGLVGLCVVLLVMCAGWINYARQYPTIDNPPYVRLGEGARLLYRDPAKGVWSTSTTYEYTQVYRVDTSLEALAHFYTNEGLSCSSFATGTKLSAAFDLQPPYVRCVGDAQPTGGVQIEMQRRADLVIAESVTPARRAFLNRILQPAKQEHPTSTLLLIRIGWAADPWPL